LLTFALFAEFAETVDRPAKAVGQHTENGAYAGQQKHRSYSLLNGVSHGWNVVQVVHGRPLENG